MICGLTDKINELRKYKTEREWFEFRQNSIIVKIPFNLIG